MKANFETGLKICSHCRRELTFDRFNKCKSFSDGLEAQCKDCKRTAAQKPERKLMHNKVNAKYRKTDKGRMAQKRYESSECRKQSMKRINRKRYESGKNAEYIRNKRKVDVEFAIKESLRNRIYCAIRNNQKSAHTLELLGCSLDELKVHLEQQFEPGMTWNNYGEWHIDHIIPCSYFDLTKEENQRICFNYRNLQPLWAEENRKKKDSLPENVEELIQFLKQEIYGIR